MANNTELGAVLSWTFSSQVTVPKDVNELLVPGEEAIVAYQTIRDVAIFTNKRLIVKDAQGITGKKVEMYTLPYKSIVMYSSENAGKLLDINAEMELWTLAGHIKIKISSGADVRKIDKILAEYIL